MMRLALLIATTLVLGASLVPAVAQAASVSVDTQDDQLNYVGSSSEANNVSVSVSGWTYTVIDTGATISAGSGCTSVNANKVTCTSNDIDRVNVDTNGGNDAITINGPIASFVDAGSGNDLLVGGTSQDWLFGDAGDDHLAGGLGADLLSGGDGVDTADFSARTAPLTITLSTSGWEANDGEAGEKDYVSSSVEVVLGGSGNDTITGSSANNTLKGGPGDDRLSGAGGDDTLEGGPGRDSLDGGDGADVLRARDGLPDQITCGNAFDTGDADSIDGVAPDCEGIVLSGPGPVGDMLKTPLDLVPRRITISRRGRVLLRIGCPQALGTCEGTLVLRELGKGRRKASASRRRSKVVGRAKYKLSAGETKVLDVKLSRNGRRRVLRKKRLRCRASSTTRGTNGRKTSVGKNITLKAPKRRKKS